MFKPVFSFSFSGGLPTRKETKKGRRGEERGGNTRVTLKRRTSSAFPDSLLLLFFFVVVVSALVSFHFTPLSFSFLLSLFFHFVDIFENSLTGFSYYVFYNQVKVLLFFFSELFLFVCLFVLLLVAHNRIDGVRVCVCAFACVSKQSNLLLLSYVCGWFVRLTLCFG